MMKISIKREQSQAGLSFAESEKFRPQVKNKLFLLLALLLTAATGAWAAAENETIIFNNLGLANAYELTSATLTVGNINLDFANGTGSSTPAFYTSGGGTVRLYKGNTMSVDASGATITKIVFTYASEVTPEFSTGSYNSSTKTWEGEATTLTVTNAYTNNTQIRIMSMDVYYSAAAGYTVSMKDGVKDADKWTVKVGEGQAQALPIGGLNEGDAVTLQYNGRLKVKGVKATSDAAPAAVPVTSITLNKTETSIKVGATETLSVTSVLPEEATDKTYTWKTSDETKATVDQDGKVTAVAAGTVTIYAEANDGSGVKGNCSVTVTPATITVTINQSDWGGWGTPITKDGVTVSAGMIDPMDGNLMSGGTFSTTLGNFTKIEVTCEGCDATGTGWSGNYSKKTWAGTPASTVNFSGNFMGMGSGITIVCTIVPTN